MDTNKNIIDLKQTEQSYIDAIKSQPNDFEPYFNLGKFYAEHGDVKAALKVLNNAYKIDKENPQLLELIGDLLLNDRQSGQAILAFKKWTQLEPKSSKAHNFLGEALIKQNLITNSITVYKKAIQLDSQNDIAYINCATALAKLGDHILAEEYFNKALKLNTENFYYSNYFLAQNYRDDVGPEKIYKESVDWGNSITDTKQIKNVSFNNIVDKSRRIRIGYVSSHFMLHSGSYTTIPLLKNHNTEDFEIFCYNDNDYNDAITADHKKLTHHWTEVSAWTDEKIEEQIRKDEIDILVDLHGHAGKNRLQIFANRSAPVQITWLGYPNTTGIPEMDYRLVDANTDPDNARANALASEKLVRLPEIFICYDPLRPTPKVSQLPCIKNDFITFGSFNNYCKLTDTTFRLWAEILREVPKSKLIIKNLSFIDTVVKRNCLKIFENLGISHERLMLVSHTRSLMQHLGLYAQMDISLDPYPYHGTITTCESLWMGVPVITLQGDHHRARVSSSILKCIGLEDFVAKSEDEYIQIAKQWSMSTEKLSELRSVLRQKVKSSTLNNAAKFTNNLEKVYRQLWSVWCKKS